MNEDELRPVVPPGSSADWNQVDTKHEVLIKQRFLEVIVGFSPNTTVNTVTIQTGSQDDFVIATLTNATRVENVKAVFALPYQSPGDNGVKLTVTLVSPAVAGEQVIVCLYQPAMNV